MRSVQDTSDAQGHEKGNMLGSRSQEVTPSSASGSLPDLNYDASTKSKLSSMAVVQKLIDVLQAHERRESDGTIQIFMQALGRDTDLEEEPDPPAGSSPLKTNEPMKQGVPSWISRGSSDKMGSIGIWREEVEGIDTTFEALHDDPE
jgi:hypothetical protein